MNDFKSMFHNPHSHQLLSTVPPMHHEGVGESLNDGALRLPKALCSITSSRVGQVLGILFLHGNVILQIIKLNIKISTIIIK
jgi:hypothetical protein